MDRAVQRVQDYALAPVILTVLAVAEAAAMLRDVLVVPADVIPDAVVAVVAEAPVPEAAAIVTAWAAVNPDAILVVEDAAVDVREAVPAEYM